MGMMSTLRIGYSLINDLSFLHRLLFSSKHMINAPKDRIHMLQTYALGLGNEEVANCGHYEITPHEKVERVEVGSSEERWVGLSEDDVCPAKVELV